MLTQLLRIAKKSTHPLHKHASIVTKGGAILSVGYNHNERHSEVVALKKLWPSKRRGTTVINLRLRKSGVIGDSSPCAECREFMKEQGVKKVIVMWEEGVWKEERI